MEQFSNPNQMNLFCCSSPTVVIPYTSHPHYKGAGVLFTDAHHALAGVQARMTPPCLSGLGGKREATDVDWFDTAWREVIEELLEVRDVGRVLRRLRTSLPPRETNHGGYVVLSCSFQDLQTFLGICRSEGLVSPLYKRIPTHVMDLIQARTPGSEIGSLALLPLRPSNLTIHALFQNDLALA